MNCGKEHNHELVCPDELKALREERERLEFELNGARGDLEEAEKDLEYAKTHSEEQFKEFQEMAASLGREAKEHDKTKAKVTELESRVEAMREAGSSLVMIVHSLRKKCGCWGSMEGPCARCKPLMKMQDDWSDAISQKKGKVSR